MNTLRLVKEQFELAKKIEKLSAVSTTYKFWNLSGKGRSLVNKQLEHMINYNDVLVERLEIIKALK